MINKIQQKKIEQIKASCLERMLIDGAFLSICEIKEDDCGAWVRVEARRPDCEEFSMRDVMLRQRGFFLVGVRGKITAFKGKYGTKTQKAKFPLIYGFETI